MTFSNIQFLSIDDRQLIKNELYRLYIDKNYRIYLTDQEQIEMYNSGLNLINSLNEAGKHFNLKRLPLPLWIKWNDIFSL